MKTCLTIEQMGQFLQLIAAPFHYIDPTTLIIEATAGPVSWVWTGASYCIGG